MTERTILTRLQALNRRMVAFESALAGTLVLVVFLVVLLQVAMRYLLARPNPWSEEVSRLCFVWLSMLGASLAVHHQAHFAFSQALGRLSRRAQRLARRLATSVVGLSAVGLLVFGVELVRITHPQRSPALNLSLAFLYAAVPVGAALVLIHLASAASPSREDT